MDSSKLSGFEMNISEVMAVAINALLQANFDVPADCLHHSNVVGYLVTNIILQDFHDWAMVVVNNRFEVILQEKIAWS